MNTGGQRYIYRAQKEKHNVQNEENGVRIIGEVIPTTLSNYNEYKFSKFAVRNGVNNVQKCITDSFVRLWTYRKK